MSPEISKPEWFQMAEDDAIPAAPKNKKGIRLMAIAAPLLVLGAGLAYAQTQGTAPADAGTTAQAAANPIAVTSTATTPTTPVATTPSAPESSAPNASSHEGSAPVAKTVLVSQTTTTPTPVTPVTPATTITKPGLTMPTSGGEDDGQERSSDDD